MTGLIIEPLRVEDHDALWRLWNHPEIIPRRGKGTEATFLEFATWLANRVLFPWNNVMYGLKVDLAFIGCLSYEKKEDSIDIHILIHPNYHKLGHGPHAIINTLPFIKARWGAEEIYAGIVDDNKPARKMFTKLGFEYRGSNVLNSGRRIVGFSLIS